MKKHIHTSHLLALGMLLIGLSIPSAHGDDNVEGGISMVVNTKWKEECSGCHIAYPPRFLPAQSWRAVMSGLGKHFGSDASLDVATTQEIATFLEKNADQRKRSMSSKPVLRISEMRWFKSEHDEVSARTWKNPKVKSPANCGACHTQADMGDFSERNVRIPR